MMQLFKLWAKAAASPPPSSPTKTGKKRNRALEQQRRKITLFQKGLHAESKALHDDADRRRQDDPKKRFNKAAPTASSRRLRAREIERIGHVTSSASAPKTRQRNYKAEKMIRHVMQLDGIFRHYRAEIAQTIERHADERAARPGNMSAPTACGDLALQLELARGRLALAELDRLFDENAALILQLMDVFIDGLQPLIPPPRRRA